MRALVHGHIVATERVDGLRNHWRVRADGKFVGLIVVDRDDWRTLPANRGPVCHCPSSMTAVASLIAEVGL